MLNKYSVSHDAGTMKVIDCWPNEDLSKVSQK